VEDAMKKAIATLPGELARSITWDQGAEMANHKRFTVATGIPVYFCDPHSPWQRGSNENTNGLLRQYMPKGTDLSAAQCRQGPGSYQRSLNGRPRKTLGYMTPSEKFAESLRSLVESATGMGNGGGIYNGGTLTVTDSSVSGNETNLGGEGGGIYNSGSLTLTNSTVSDNASNSHGVEGIGGGVYNTGTLTMVGRHYVGRPSRNVPGSLQRGNGHCV
jgi:hypothetical protein